MENLITSEIIERYGRHLREEARAEGTVEKYLRDVSAFAGWLDGREVSAERAAEWRQELIDSGRAPATVNAMIASVNGLLSFLGLGEMKVRYLKIQRRAFRERARELTREEYQRLLGAAERRGARLRLLMETICGTGIRVSEVRFITVEAAREGQAEISRGRCGRCSSRGSWRGSCCGTPGSGASGRGKSSSRGPGGR